MALFLNILDYYHNIGENHVVEKESKNYGIAKLSAVITNNKGEKYFLKCFPKSVSQKRVQFIAESQNYIAQNTGYAPKIYKNKCNKLFSQNSTGSFILSEYIRAQNFTISDLLHELGTKVYYILGKFLGLIHSSYYQFVSYCGYDKKLVLNNSLSRIKDLIDYHKFHTKNEFYIESLLYKYEEILRFPKDRFMQFNSLPRQVIHGDFYVNNLLFNENKEIIALIDYEQSCCFFRVYEIMRGFFYTLCADSFGGSLQDKIESFICGYLESTNLCYTEITNAVELYYWIQLNDLYGFIHHAGTSFSLDLTRFRMSLLKKFANRKEEINRMLVDLYDRIMKKKNYVAR
ncbi:MAG: aminoglycoside phosphotransferase family protein [candidate division WOR-3 bacterium]